MSTFHEAFAAMPLVAILRGLNVDTAAAVGDALVEAGFRFIEVPLNSPDPFASIALLVRRLPQTVLVGAGTVLTEDDVARLADVGGRLMVAPNVNPAIIAAAKQAGMVTMPGALTPTECFQALDAGATGLKIFPAGRLGPGYIKDIRAVLPKEMPVLPVGGVDATNMADYVKAGASGFGLGTTLYTPGKPVAEIAASARTLVEAYDRARA